MAQEEQELRVEIRMTAEDAYSFVDRLRDTDFRDQLSNDPYGVLREHGIELPPEFFSGPVELPKVEEIEAILEQIPTEGPFRPELNPAWWYVILYVIGVLLSRFPPARE